MDPQGLIGPVTTRTLRIDQFDTFILNNIPYGAVQPEHVDWGAIEYDGPAADGITGSKPLLQWHFGGIPYPISKAIRIYYTYVRAWDGSNARITASILLGFQGELTRFVLPQAIPFVENPTQTFRTRRDNLGPYGGYSTQVWASDPGVLASEADALVTRSVEYDAANLTMFNTLLQDELGQPRFDLLLRSPIPIDFDGPAQTSDSHRIFEYTSATLFNAPDRYAQVLLWYFAGKPWRLTKAMRIPLDALLGQSVFQQSVVLQAGDPGHLISAQMRFGQLGAEAEARKAAEERRAKAKAAHLRANQVRATAAMGGASETAVADAQAEARKLAEEEASGVTDVRPGGEALFIGFTGPDPGSGA
jgi:hypothetical protein